VKIALRKLCIKGAYLNRIKAIYNKPTANIILKGERLKLFPVISRSRQAYIFFPLLFNVVLKFLARAIRQEKEIKGIKPKKEEFVLSLFADGVILFSKDPKEITKKLLDLMNSFGRVVGCKNQCSFSTYQ
jgi:hypothetical protein